MSRINNTIKTEGNLTTILVTKNDDTSYLKEILVDTEDLNKLSKVTVRTTDDYPVSNKQMIAHIIMNHNSNRLTVIDHINGNRLDNRKCNLRVLTQADNANNRSKTKSNLGIPGISKRFNGNYSYLRAQVSDRSHPVVSGQTRSACKRYSKQFNINKLGEEEALKQAKQWLEEKRKEFGYM